MNVLRLTNDLRMATVSDNLPAVDAIIAQANQKGLCLDGKVNKCRTVMCLALQQNKMAVFQRLVDHVTRHRVNGLDGTECDHNGRSESLMIFAARNYNSSAVVVLMEYGADVDVCDVYGHTALWYCVRLGMDETVMALLGHGGGVHTQSAYNWTPLFTAIKYKRCDEVISLLVYYNSDLRGTGNTGICGSLLYMAARTGRVWLVDMLLSLGVQVYDQGRKNDPLWMEILEPGTMGSAVRSALNTPPCLQVLCRLSIRGAMTSKSKRFVSDVLSMENYPLILKHYILVEDLHDAHNTITSKNE